MKQANHPPTDLKDTAEASAAHRSGVADESSKAKPPSSTPRVRRSRANRDAGMIFVPGFWLSPDEAQRLADRGVVKDWNTEAQNAAEVSALLRMNLRALLKF